MDEEMVAQTSLGTDFLPAVITHEPLAPVLMHSHVVVLEVSLLQESLIAQFAPDVFVISVIFGMTSRVALQSCLVVARPAADVTDVVARAVFGAHVVVVLLAGEEALVANFAFSHVILQVYLPVGYQGTSGAQFFRTKIAFKR